MTKTKVLKPKYWPRKGLQGGGALRINPPPWTIKKHAPSLGKRPIRDKGQPVSNGGGVNAVKEKRKGVLAKYFGS